MHPGATEQDAVKALIAANENNCNAHIQVVPQWKINAFPEEIHCYDEAKKSWERGMFVVHFAGAWAYLKEEDPYGILMRKYKDQVVT